MAERPRVTVVSAVRFGSRCLEILARADVDVVGAVGWPIAPTDRMADHEDLLTVAARHRIPGIHARDLAAGVVVDTIRSWRPDASCVLGWPRLIPRSIRDLASVTIGSHPTLLPRDRGRHPLIWTLVDGYTRGGLTFFVLADDPDGGDIVWQRSFPITIDDDAGSLYRRIEDLAAGALPEIVSRIASGTLERRTQDHAGATYRRRRTERDGLIDWQLPSRRIHDLIRALARPYPGAHTYLDGERVIVWRSRLAEAGSCPPRSGQPGQIAARHDAGWLVETGDCHIVLEEITGSRPLRAGGVLGSVPLGIA